MSDGRVPIQGFDWRAFDAYLFDIDGTLLNSRDGVHYHAFHAGLREAYGCDEKIDGVPVHGNTDIGILRAATRLAGIGEEEFRRGLPKAIATMQAEVERNAAGMLPQVCPSIEKLLTELRAEGKLLAVASGNLEPIGWAKLRAANLARFFSFGSFSDRHETRTEIFRYGAERAREILGTAARVCFVGDTPNDVAAARELSLPVIAVATGTYTYDQLCATGPDICLTCCDDLFAGLESR
ncbi:MAG TPA: HAD family hydrolase [Clostridia bacterium]|nr:HAD family hydrolase [Clostridia bacterium]